MTDHCSIPHPLKREGTYQWQRLQEGLKKGFYKPDDRTIEQIVAQIAEYASYVKYYDTTLNESGRWETFYEFLYDYGAKKLRFANIDSLLQNGKVPPHIGLLLSFLKTFDTVRESFNDFTDRHLDFYYGEVLQLKRKDSVADKVAVLFEPEKNTAQAKVEAGRELNAGKDGLKKDLVYKTIREIIVNQAVVAKTKTVFADKAANGNLKALHIAKDASAENQFTQNNVASWSPFGTKANPAAQLGFAISSPVLFAKEGRRRLSLEIEGGASLPRTSLTAFYTGPKGWVEAEVDLAPGIDNNSSAISKRYLLVKIDESLPAVVAYNEKLHKDGLPCIYPVVKLYLKNDSSFPAAYNFFSILKLGNVKKIVMNVEGAASFTITGENGNLNSLQAFKPFGSTPVKNKSFFTIGSSEAFNKYSKTFHLAANWKGAPGNMFKYYKGYDDFLMNRDIEKRLGTFKGDNYTTFRAPLLSFDQGNVPGRVELMSGGKWVKIAEDTPNQYKTPRASTYNTFHVTGKIKDEFDATNSSSFSEASRWGFAKITLQYDFGHSIYASVLADVMMQNALNKVESSIKPIPSPPYTPEFNSLRLDYVLEDIIDINSRKEHSFIQLHPFGFQSITSAQQFLIPSDYNAHGQLYIGLSGLTGPQIINLFIARLDGTENIDAVINEKLQLYYLKGSSWAKFKFEDVVVDTTHGFTSAGFLSFSIPADALATNTLMGENLVWLKLVSATSAAAYPSIIAIHTNAVEAEFDDRENDPFHLQTPLPAGTIAKPLLKIDGVKTVIQPYASYGGKMPEQEEQFNARISERLRHKNRSWSIWDFEHVVLERFPQIYKIKCISHAKKDDMYAPGQVLCVVLPAIVNIAEKDLLQPRLSRALLAEAKEYIAQFTTSFAHVEFTNPIYETITVKCSVKIKAGYDENYYGSQLNKDIQQYLSPWILNKTKSPSFGGKIYSSAIINFIEELEYIDYLTQFEASKVENNKLVIWKEETSGSSEAVILTSALQHQIDTNAIC